MDTKIVQELVQVFAQKLTTNISLIVNKPNYLYSPLKFWKYIHQEYLSSVMTKIKINNILNGEKTVHI
jgi:hypothetical protein